MSLIFFKFFKDIDKLKSLFDKNFIKEIESKFKLFSKKNSDFILFAKKFEFFYKVKKYKFFYKTEKFKFERSIRLSDTIIPITFFIYSSGKNKIFITQNLFFGDNIIIPQDNICLINDLLFDNYFTNTSYENFQKIHQNLLKKKDPIETIIIDQSRPFHFICHQLPGVINYLNSIDLSQKKKIEIFLDKRSIFFKKDLIEKILDKKVILKDIKNLNDELLLENREYFYPVCNLRSMDKNFKKKFNEKILNNLQFNTDYQNNEKFKLWIGIIGQRRNYLNQVEFIQKILSYFTDLFSKKKILFIFDGWTSSDNFEEDKRSTDEDNEILKKVLSPKKFKDLNTISLIGSKMDEKIYYANKINLAIIPNGSGGNLVSCLLSKKTIIHSNSYMKKDKYYLDNLSDKNVYYLSNNTSQDLSFLNKEKPHMINYKVKSQLAINEIKEIFKTF